jgi:hypothetical protein
MKPTIYSFTRRGYVLIVAMGLLVLSATLLVAVSRGAMQRALSARIAADELQHRWAILSSRAAILPFAETILTEQEAKRHVPIPALHARLQLGDESFEFIIGDESAKANVNLLADHVDRSVAEDRLRIGLSGTGTLSNIHLRPGDLDALIQTSPTSAPTSRPAKTIAMPRVLFTGFGQVFDDASPSRLLGRDGSANVADILTCWSGGQVNLRRVSPAALKLASGVNLSGIDQGRLLTTRNLLLQGKRIPPPKAGPIEPDPVAALISSAGVDPKGVAALPPFTLQSTCHSLWIISHDSRRTWYDLFIVDTTDRNHPRSLRFAW